MARHGEAKTYTHVTAMFIIINYAVGTGILNLPHTVASASIGVSCIMIAAISFSSYLLGQYSLEAISKTFALLRIGMIPMNTAARQEFDAEPHEVEALNAQGEASAQSTTPTTCSEAKADYSIPNNTVFQMSSLCSFYFGKAGFIIYQLGVCVYFFGTIWGYTSVIAQTLTSVVPLTFLPRYDGKGWECADPCQGNYAGYCSDSYWIWTAATCVFSTILIFFNLADQKVLQSVFTFCRFLLLGLTCAVIIFCLATQPYLKDGYQLDSGYINPNIKYFEFSVSTMGTLFSSVTFSQVYHHSLPGIFQPVRADKQPRLGLSLAVGSLFLFSVTVLVSLPGALYFGNDGADLVVMNFGSWTGNGFGGSSRPVIVSVLSYTMRILPPFYVLSSVPINGLTMSLNVQQMIPEHIRARRWVVVVVNMLCVVPAVLLAGFLRCLGTIIEFTGLMGYILMLGPALCCIWATRRCNKVFSGQKCPFSNKMSMQWLMVLVVVFNLIGFCLTTFSLIYGLVAK